MSWSSIFESVRRMKRATLGERFPGSKAYWEDRYARGGNSGAGSYSELAEFKAKFINRFVDEHKIEFVIEFGCGDGNQLSLANYPKYLGLDVSQTAIDLCKHRFQGDSSKEFRLAEAYAGETAPLSLSLDVIYHLIEDEVFEQYMHQLFSSSTQFVIIYSSDIELAPDRALHVRHRQFTQWVARRRPERQLQQHVKNAYPFTGDNRRGSMADFFVYRTGQH